MSYRHDSPQLSKKAKKAQKHANSNLNFDDQAALNRRAERFQREHELERHKNMRGQGSLQANNQSSHLFNRISRSDSPSVFGTNPDDPEADPVRLAIASCASRGCLCSCSERAGLG